MKKIGKLYLKEQNNTRLLYVIGIAFFIFGIITAFMLRDSWKDNERVPELVVKLWFLSIVPFLLIMIYCIKLGNIVGREATNYIRWKRYLTRNGIKHEGTITDIRKVYRTGTSERSTYYYRITYFSEARREEITFETSALAFNPYKKGYKYCTVYEVTDKASWALPFQDATDSVMVVSGNRLQFTLNPFKLWKAIDTKSRQNWFGEYVAADFR